MAFWIAANEKQKLNTIAWWASIWWCFHRFAIILMRRRFFTFFRPDSLLRILFLCLSVFSCRQITVHKWNNDIKLWSHYARKHHVHGFMHLVKMNLKTATTNYNVFNKVMCLLLCTNARKCYEEKQYRKQTIANRKEKFHKARYQSDKWSWNRINQQK